MDIEVHLGKLIPRNTVKGLLTICSFKMLLRCFKHQNITEPWLRLQEIPLFRTPGSGSREVETLLQVAGAQMWLCHVKDGFDAGLLPGFRGSSGL